MRHTFRIERSKENFGALPEKRVGSPSQFNHGVA